MRKREEEKKTKTSFLCHFQPGSRKEQKREEEKKRRREENKKTKTSFLCHFQPSSRKGRKYEEKKKRRRKYEIMKTKTSFLYHFDADSRKQGMRQRSDLEVVTAPNDAVDAEDAQNGKEKRVVTALNDAADAEDAQNGKEKRVVTALNDAADAEDAQNGKEKRVFPRAKISFIVSNPLILPSPLPALSSKRDGNACSPHTVHNDCLRLIVIGSHIII